VPQGLTALRELTLSSYHIEDMALLPPPSMRRVSMEWCSIWGSVHPVEERSALPGWRVRQEAEPEGLSTVAGMHLITLATFERDREPLFVRRLRTRAQAA